VDPGAFPVEAHLSHLRLKNASAGSVEQRLYSLLLAVTHTDLDDWQHSNAHRSPATTAGYVSYSHAAAVKAVERVGAGLAVPGVPSVILPRAVAD